MNNLLKADFYVLLKSKAFFICLVILILFSIAMPPIYRATQEELGRLSNQDKQMVEQVKDFIPEGTQGLNIGFTSSAVNMEQPIEPDITWFTGQILAGGALLFVLAIFVSNHLITEFYYGTIRNSIAKGFSRTKIYLSKWLTMVTAGLIYLVVMLLFGMLSTIVWYGISPITPECIRIIGMEILLYIAVISIFTMVGMIFHKKISVVITNIMVVMAASSLLAGISLLLGNSIILTQYWIPSNIAEMGEIIVENEAILRCGICAIIYTIISTLVGIQIFKRKDIR